MPKPFYITTAIDYTNGAPHIGHAYEKVLADVIARYHRLKGDEVFFLTGVDQHGQKVQQSAEKAGVAPQQFVDEITAKFIALWEKLDVRYDGWAATTDPLHKKCVQGMLQRLYDESRSTKTNRRATTASARSNSSPTKNAAPMASSAPSGARSSIAKRRTTTSNSPSTKIGCSVISSRIPTASRPTFRQTELINAVEKLSGDLCISRPKSRLELGHRAALRPRLRQLRLVRCPNELHQLRRLRSRISSFILQPSSFQEKWPALHVIGKDILIPAHGIYWPIMLHALGFPDEQMPKFLVHGWWNISGAKMSKSVRQRRRSRCSRRQIRRGSAALLFDERHRHRKRRGLFGGATRSDRFNAELAKFVRQSA